VSNGVYKRMVEEKKIFDKLQFTFKISMDNLNNLESEEVRFNMKEYSKIWVMLLEDLLPLLMSFNEKMDKLKEEIDKLKEVNDNEK